MRGEFIWGGAYTWSNTSVKEKVGLFAGGLYSGAGFIGGEIRHSTLSDCNCN